MDRVSADATSRFAGLFVENHRSFLSYVERKVGNRALAEDILQDAFVRSADRTDDVPEEALASWFYRVLRNAVIDHWRRRSTANRALESYAHELETTAALSDELHGEICACVSRLAASLKPEYEEALREVDVRGIPVKAFAERHGLSPSNAGVRVHRARQALRQRVTESCGTCAEHGCLDCSCQPASGKV